MTDGVAGVYVPEEPENEYAGVVVPEEEHEPGMKGRFYSTISRFLGLRKYLRASICFPEQASETRGGGDYT